MKLSRTVQYALRATLLLAQEETLKPVPCSQLAREGEMPERFLLQILRNLVNQGLLRSTRGVDGGYSLVKSPEDVSVLNIIEAIDGPMKADDEAGELPTLEDLAVGEGDDPQHKLREALAGVSHSLRRQLDAIKIAHLLPQPTGRN